LRLKEEIRMELEDQNIIKPELERTEQPQKKKYRGVISGRIERWRDQRREKNRPTFEQLQELKLQARIEQEKAKIAIAKKKQKDNKTSRFDFHIPGKIFTEVDDKQYKSYKKKISNDDKDYSVLGF